MKSRSEIHQQSNVGYPKRRLNPLTIIFDAIIITMLFASLILSQTLLSERFAKHEVANSTLSSVMVNLVSQNLSQYGIPTSQIPESQVNKLLKEAVGDVYEGKAIDLDLEPILTSAESTITKQAAQYGIAATLESDTLQSANKTASDTLNSQLNTSQVSAFITGLSVAKTVNWIVLIISGVITGLIIIRSILKRQIFAKFFWVGLISVILVYLLIIGVVTGITEAGSSYSDFASFTSQLSADFQTAAQEIWYLLPVMTGLFGLGAIVKFLLGRR